MEELTSVDNINKILESQLEDEKKRRISVSKQLDLSKELLMIMEQKINISDLKESDD